MSIAEPVYLVGIDGSIQSRAALAWALKLADATGARVEAIAVWSIPPSLITPGFIGARHLPLDIFEKAAKGRLHEAIAEKDSPLPVPATVVKGHAGAELADRSTRYDLVVVGRTGRGRISRMLTGSTARYLAHHAHSPVALISDHDVDTASVMVAIDGSTYSLGALRWATSLPQQWPLSVVHSHDEKVLSEWALPDSIRAALDGRAKDLVTEAIRSADLDPAAFETEVRAGDPRATIIDQLQPDQLLVLGAAGHNVVAATIFGSVSSYAIDHCPSNLVIWR